MRFQSILSLALAGAVAMPAQEAGQAKLVQTKATLKINILEGEGGRNNIRSRTAVAPVVEVKDAAEKPVVGAEVVFQLPMVGPSGMFNGWLKTQTVRTDDQGKASVSGYTPNTEEGRFNIKVTATSGSQSGSAVIAQSNVVGNGAGAKKSHTWKIVAIAGGAALVGGIVAASRGDSTPGASAAAVPITISAGAITVGGPR